MKLRDRFPHEVDGDVKSFGQGGTAALVHMVRVRVRDQDGANGSRIDAGIFHPAPDFDRAEPGIEEQIAFGTVHDGGVAFAAAAEDGAAERGGLNGKSRHGLVPG